MHIVDKFCDFYQALNLQTLNQLPHVYSNDIYFCDPAHQIQGLDKLTTYFENLISNVVTLNFDIAEQMAQANSAYIRWEMTYSHPKINQGQQVVVPGVSHLLFTDKINHHQDYFDFGCMLYEHLPIMKWGIALVKRRLTA